MSFQDLESGDIALQVGQRHIEQGPSSRALAAGVFKINTAVAGYKRLVNCIGTPKDTVDLRHKLRKTRIQIRELVKETSSELDHVRETNKFTEVNATKKIADAKLTKDYESILREFQKVQLLAAEKEKTFAPPISNSTHQPSHIAGELEISSLSPRQASLVRESNRQVIHMANEAALNEAIIEEREQGIREIQTQIGEVNEIFKDLALLVREQGGLIDHISSNIEGSHTATSQATSELGKASKIQRTTSSTTCLMLVIVAIILLIIVFMVVV